MSAGRDLGSKAIAEQGVQRVWKGSSYQISTNTPATVSLPDLSANAGGALAGAGTVPSASHFNISNQPGILIGQKPTPIDRSIRLYRYATFSTVSTAVTIPTSGGVSLEVDTVQGFTAGASTAVYAPLSGSPVTISYTSLTAAAWPNTVAKLNGCTVTGSSLNALADVHIIPGVAPTQHDPYLAAGGTFDFSSKSFVISAVVRLNDALHHGIGGSGTGSESGTRRSLCVFGALANGAGSSPGTGQAIYCMIDPNNGVSGATGHVRVGWDSSHEVTLNDAVAIGKSYLIVVQYDSGSGNTSIWVVARGAADVVTTSANIGGPGSIGSAAAFNVGRATLGGTLYSFMGYVGFAGIWYPSTAWDTAKARSYWVESGLDTANNFGGGLPYGGNLGASDTFDTAILSRDLPVDSGAAWRGNTRAQQAPLDWSGFMGNTNNLPGYNSRDFSNTVYVVDESIPEVEVVFHPDLNQQDMVTSMQMGVPIPAEALPALGTDSTLCVWRPSTDEYWEIWSSTTKTYNSSAPVAGVNGRSLNNSRWNAGYGGWQSNFSRLRGHFDGGFSYFGNGGWGAAATRIPYGFGAVKISEMLAGEIRSAVHISGAINHKPPDLVLVSSTIAGGSSTSGIASGGSFTGAIGDTITVDDANGWPQFGACELVTLLSTGSQTLQASSFTLNLATSTGAFPNSTGTVYCYSDTGRVAIAYTGKTGNTLTGCTGGSGQTLSSGSPVTFYKSFSEFGIMKIGTDYFMYGLLVGNTFKGVMNVSNAGNTAAGTGSPPPQASQTSQAASAGTAVTRTFASNQTTTASMPFVLDSYTWPANGSDGYQNAPCIIQEGNTFRLPATTSFDDSLPAYTYRTWSRPSGVLDSFTKMIAKAVQKYGMVIRDKSGSVPLYLEEPWEYMKARGYNPYTGRVFLGQANGTMSSGTLAVVSTTNFVQQNSGSGYRNNANANTMFPSGKCYVPARGVTFTYCGAASNQLTGCVGNNLASIQSGDYFMVLFATAQQAGNTDTNATAFASTPAGYQALYPLGVEAGVPLFPSAAVPNIRNFPWEMLELLDPTSLQNGLSSFRGTSGGARTTAVIEKTTLDNRILCIAPRSVNNLILRVQNTGASTIYVSTSPEMLASESFLLGSGLSRQYESYAGALYARCPSGSGEARVLLVG